MEIHKNSIVIVSPPLPLSPNEKQVQALIYNDLSYLLWYEPLNGLIHEFPLRTQPVFRYILNQLPIVCHYCDVYTCISTREKLTLKKGLQLAKIIHKDITQNTSRFADKIPRAKRRKSEVNFLDAQPALLPTYRLTISVAYIDQNVIYIPHREFLFFSLPYDDISLFEELNKLFEDFHERYSSREVHILITLKRFKHIKKGFLRGIIPMSYFLGSIVDYDFDPVDWSWVDNEPFRDPSTRFFMSVAFNLIFFGYFFF